MFLNSKEIPKTDNMYVAYRVDVNDMLWQDSMVVVGAIEPLRVSCGRLRAD